VQQANICVAFLKDYALPFLLGAATLYLQFYCSAIYDHSNRKAYYLKSTTSK
jgi:hypothetical protein